MAGLPTPEALWRAVHNPLAIQATTANWTGLLTADLMVLQVPTSARLPWRERTWGRAALVRWHAGLAWASWWLVVLHVLLFTAQRVPAAPAPRASSCSTPWCATGRCSPRPSAPSRWGSSC